MVGGRRFEYSCDSVEAPVVLRILGVRDRVSSASAWRCSLFGILDEFGMISKMSQCRENSERMMVVSGQE